MQLLLIRNLLRNRKKTTANQLNNFCLSWSLNLKIPFNAEFTLLLLHERPLVPLPGLGQQPLSEAVSLYNTTLQTLQKVQRILISEDDVTKVSPLWWVTNTALIMLLDEITNTDDENFQGGDYKTEAQDLDTPGILSLFLH